MVRGRAGAEEEPADWERAVRVYGLARRTAGDNFGKALERSQSWTDEYVAADDSGDREIQGKQQASLDIRLLDEDSEVGTVPLEDDSRSRNKTVLPSSGEGTKTVLSR